ncbi:DNA-binding protein [Marinilabiliaceae bacterium JC040]|nr:DNA-binding protein [Marinilabiliaceae bacterium JC040]
MKDLTNSDIQRQNILNNRFAIDKVQRFIGITGLLFREEYRFTKKMVSDFYDIDISTVDRYLSKYDKELKHNGYVLIRGNALKDFKLEFGHLIGEATKTTVLGIFNFRSFINLGMLLSESNNAKLLRSKILDIVIDTINEKTGGGTKFINRKDADYLTTAIRESTYRKEFTSALSRYVDMGSIKYSLYTDKIYQAVFNENAKEYKKILKLEAKDNARESMYSEVLNIIASFETGIAYEIRKESESKNEKLSKEEVDEIFERIAKHPMQRPHIEDARIKMSSRDLHFRDAFHQKLENYIQAVSSSDFERFMGEQSVDFEKQLEEAKDVFERLKDSE